jgi:hypothetical protein
MLEFLFLFLELKLWMNPSLKYIFQISTIMHQTCTSVENYQIVIIFCLHCMRNLHSPCPIVWACNNYLHLLTNWMPSKSFICGVLELARIDVCLLTIRVHSKSSFNMGAFEFARISHTSIGYLNATQKLRLLVHAFKVD